jgi:hypothetical protein
MLLFIAARLFSQQTNPNQPLVNQDYLKKPDYLEKSKNQKTAAWILLGEELHCTLQGFLCSKTE